VGSSAAVWRLLSRAEAAIAREDWDAAEARLARLRRLAPELPELAMTEGELASRRGDSAAACAAWERAAALAPDWVAPRIELGVEHLFGRDDPARALEWAEGAAAGADEPAERARASLLAASARWALGDDDDARRRLAGVEVEALDDAAWLLEAGDRWLALGEPERAVPCYRAAVAREPSLADAWHGLGCARAQLDARSAHAEAIEAWLTVRRLDREAPRPAFRLSEDELEAVAERTLRELPAEVRQRLGNLPILVEDLPSEALVRDGVDPRLLGLFTGTPLPERSHVGGVIHGPDTVHLFLRNLERACEDREALEEQVRITILHETAHFFGLDEDEVEALGLG
jgi:predicted Zn-dependent protease with MMP-like domain